jgi:hypothetical protein
MAIHLVHRPQHLQHSQGPPLVAVGLKEEQHCMDLCVCAHASEFQHLWSSHIAPPYWHNCLRRWGLSKGVPEIWPIATLKQIGLWTFLALLISSSALHVFLRQVMLGVVGKNITVQWWKSLRLALAYCIVLSIMELSCSSPLRGGHVENTQQCFKAGWEPDKHPSLSVLTLLAAIHLSQKHFHPSVHKHNQNPNSLHHQLTMLKLRWIYHSEVHYTTALICTMIVLWVLSQNIQFTWPMYIFLLCKLQCFTSPSA